MKQHELPEILPIFPLSGVLLLPGGRLPLNIFEPRYLAMTEAALRGDRLIGMIQPRGEGDALSLYETGCAGKITHFEETNDGRYLITLTGVARFKVAVELPQQDGFRRIRPDWSPYPKDAEHADHLGIDRGRLHTLLGSYFALEGLSCNWDTIEDTPDNSLITCLAMVCPFDAREKQALLEAGCCKDRAGLFMTLLEMAVSGRCDGKH